MVSGAQESGTKSRSKGALSGAGESSPEDVQRTTGESSDEGGEPSKSKSRSNRESE